MSSEGSRRPSNGYGEVAIDVEQHHSEPNLGDRLERESPFSSWGERPIAGTMAGLTISAGESDEHKDLTDMTTTRFDVRSPDGTPIAVWVEGLGRRS